MPDKLLVLGVSFRTAPLSLRERLAVGEDRVAQDLEALMKNAGLKEGVLLSTCNRVELIATADSPEHAVEGNELRVMYMNELFPVKVARVGSQPLFDPTDARMKS